jgi:hypothetical protein
MNCEVCSDKGIVRVNWADAPDDYAVCLCEEGLRLRVDRNHGKTVSTLWMVWCAREQIDPSRMFLIEEVLTPDELTERELRKPPVSMNREAALLAAGKQGKPR